MFSHVMIGADDLEASKVFYDATLGVLGHDGAVHDPKGRYFYRTKSGVFAITRPINGQPASHGNGSTLGFAAESQEAVDAWHAAGLANGGTDCEDPPGIREGAGMQLYLAYLRDPAGNKVCALHRIGQ
ncbi:MAG: VOC family protein [Gammaproteobacteria bacterium]|nr:VOC family protein [Gammaproteobacteria bacterium]MCY4358873.1 VOC family protein [Gammaproteobacteria bacterium]